MTTSSMSMSTFSPRTTQNNSTNQFSELIDEKYNRSDNLLTNNSQELITNYQLNHNHHHHNDYIPQQPLQKSLSINGLAYNNASTTNNNINNNNNNNSNNIYNSSSSFLLKSKENLNDDTNNNNSAFNKYASKYNSNILFSSSLNIINYPLITNGNNPANHIISNGNNTKSPRDKNKYLYVNIILLLFIFSFLQYRFLLYF